MSIMQHEGSSNSRKSRLPEGEKERGLTIFPWSSKLFPGTYRVLMAEESGQL